MRNRTMFGWDAAKDECAKHTNNIATNLVTIISTHPLEARDAAGGDPFGYEDVAGVVEASVVGMDELTVNPCLSVTAINAFLFHDAFDVITKLGDHFVSLVEQGDAGVELRNEHEVFISVDVGGESVAAESGEVLPLKAEVLQGVMGAVADDNTFLAAWAAINPNTVRGGELAITAAGAAEFGDPITFLVVAVNPK